MLRLFLRGATPNTAQARVDDLRLFARHLGLTELDAIARLLRGPRPEAVRLALHWAQEMAEAKLSPATIARRLSTLRALVTLARLVGVVEWHLEVPSPRVHSYRDTRGPSLDDLRKLFEERYSGYGPAGARNRCIIALIATLGLRRSEVSAVKLEHYDRNGRRLLVQGKGNRHVWVTLPEFTWNAIETWLSMRTELDVESEYMFVGKGTPHLQAKSIHELLSVIGDRAGIRVRPHGIRHAAVTTALDVTNGDVRASQLFGRHADPKTTLRYDDNRRDLAGDVARRVAEKLSGKANSDGT